MTPEQARRARAVWCGGCWQVPGLPCGEGYDHIDLYLRAARRGFITHGEVQPATGQRVLVQGATLEIVRYR